MVGDAPKSFYLPTASESRLSITGNRKRGKTKSQHTLGGESESSSLPFADDIIMVLLFVRLLSYLISITFARLIISLTNSFSLFFFLQVRAGNLLTFVLEKMESKKMFS